MFWLTDQFIFFHYSTISIIRAEIMSLVNICIPCGEYSDWHIVDCQNVEWMNKVGWTDLSSKCYFWFSKFLLECSLTFFTWIFSFLWQVLVVGKSVLAYDSKNCPLLLGTTLMILAVFSSKQCLWKLQVKS